MWNNGWGSHRLWRSLTLLIGAFSLVASAFLVGFGYTWYRAPREAQYGNPINLALVWEAWGYIQRYFYGPTPSAAELTYGALDGALETLNDPYTRLVRPVSNEIEQDSLRGKFGGIGAWVYEDLGKLYLLPLPDSAALKAGIQDGDQLLAVDDQALPEDAPVDLAVSWIRGPVGTEVKVTVYRPSTQEELSFIVERQEIVQPTVEWRLLTGYEPRVGYIKITYFSERTAEELQRALALVRRDGATLLVLDLRGNPGGLLESAVEVASRFLHRGIVLYELDARGEERAYTVRPRVRADEPLAVLVDEGTASAAEIVAGALQDHERAVLVGRQTHGKGSVQLAYTLSDGSSLHVTAALWLTPNRHEINGVGLTPDQVIEQSRADTDQVLEAALDTLGAEPVVTEVNK